MVEIDFSSRRVLIVDKDPQFRTVAEQAFGAIGPDLFQTSESSDQALAVLGRAPVDVIVVGGQLEDMRGVQFIRLLRDKSRGPQPNVVIVLAASSEDTRDLRAACMAGIESFVRKPIEPETLVKRVAAAVARPSRFVVARSYFGPNRRRRTVDDYGGADRRKVGPPGRAKSTVPRQEIKADAAQTRPNSERPSIQQPGDDAPSVESARPLDEAGGTPDAVIAAENSVAPPARPGPESRSAAKIESADQGETAVQDEPLVANEETAIADGQSADAWKEALVEEDGSTAGPESGDSSMDIAHLLEEHALWLNSKGQTGSKATLFKADLQGADLAGANVNRANLQEADLSGANCREASFQEADLRRADLSRADATQANMSLAMMRHTSLQSTLLDGANLRGADLAGADLRGASLNQTDVNGVNLLGTDLRNADLSSVNGLTQTQVTKAKSDTTTRLPMGLHRPDSTGE